MSTPLPLMPTPLECLFFGGSTVPGKKAGVLSLGYQGDTLGQRCFIPGFSYGGGMGTGVGGHQTRPSAGLPRVSTSCAWDDRGALLAVCCGDGMVMVWDTASPLAPSSMRNTLPSPRPLMSCRPRALATRLKE